MRISWPVAALVLLIPMRSPAAHLGPPAERAFEGYIPDLEARLARQHARTNNCVATLAGGDGRPNLEREFLTGSVLVEPVNGGSWGVDGGMMHHWRATSYIQGATPQDMLTVLRGYSRFSRYYAPEVISSRPEPGGGVMIRFRKQLVITVVLDAEFEAESGFHGNCGYGLSRSVHIWQVDQPETAYEHRRPEGADDGFLWRLSSYWSFQKWREGLLIECEAVCLTRAVPPGLGWLVTPIIQNLPRNSIEFTLAGTRNALADSVMRRRADVSAN